MIRGREFALALALLERAIWLSEINGLSPAEQRAALALLTGRSMTEIARDQCIRRKTLNQYAIAAYRKFGVHGRIELISVLLGFSAGWQEVAT